MDFNDARLVDSICFQMRQSDWERSLNRRRINDLFNGSPPYSEQEEKENGIEVNINELSGVVAAHDARAQFYNAVLKPGNYFNLKTDGGPKHRRAAIAKSATMLVNKIMKRSIEYVECNRSSFAMDVLHGIAPAGWRDPHSWCPESHAIDDVLVPARTLLSMKNLPLFAIHRSLSGPELIKMAKRPKFSDPAWNQPLVDQCLEWLDQKTSELQSNSWQEIWSPEKMGERIKGDGGFYSSDDAPTIECWDFYFWNDDGDVEGWNRRMVLDAWSSPKLGDPDGKFSRKTGKLFNKDNSTQFLYNPGKRKFANKLSEIITWQFADLSAVAPFRYHTVRSLGFLLFAISHLQNRLFSKFSEAQFEQLMIYFRVKSQDEMQRALQVNLVSRGFIDDTVDFIPAAQRYQVNTQLIDLGIRQNQNIINRNSASYTSNPASHQQQRSLTATQWLGEANKVTALVSSALNQAYLYKAVEFREIWRRFCRKNSTDPDVKEFQAKCSLNNVPESVLYSPNAWEVEPERIVGAGNKTMEMGIADWLMSKINLFDPEPQQIIKRNSVLAVTDDAALADTLVPEVQTITDATHDAQLACGAIMQGLPVAIKSGINHIDYVEAMLVSMAVVVDRIRKRDNIGTIDEVTGLRNMEQHVIQHISIIAQDKNEKQRVKGYGDKLAQLMNEVAGFEQRIIEQQQQQAANGGLDPETQAKIQAMIITAQAKAQNTRDAHAQRTAQRELQWQKKMEQEAMSRQQDLQFKARESEIGILERTAKANIDIAKSRSTAAKPKPSGKSKSK